MPTNEGRSLSIQVDHGYVGVSTTVVWRNLDKDFTGNYDIEVNYGGGWESIAANTGWTSISVVPSRPSMNVRYRVRTRETVEVETVDGTEVLSTFGEWYQSRSVIYLAKSGLQATINVAPYSSMRTFQIVMGADENDLDSVLAIRAGSQLNIGGAIEIPQYTKTSDLSAELHVLSKKEDLIDARLTIPPKSSVRVQQDVQERTLSYDSLDILKDTTNREKGSTINYGESHQIMVGHEDKGLELETLLAVQYKEPSFGDVDIEEVNLVLNKQYLTDSEYSITIREAVGEWDEYKATWVFKPEKGRIVAQERVPQAMGEFRINLTDEDWVDGEVKSYFITTRSSNAPEIAFGSRESMNPPKLEIAYYKNFPSAGMEYIDSELSVRGYRSREVSAEIDVHSQFQGGVVESFLEILGKDRTDEILSEIVVGSRSESQLDSVLDIVKKYEDGIVDGEIIVPYAEWLGASIELLRLDEHLEIDSEVVVRAKDEFDLDADLEIAEKETEQNLAAVLEVSQRRVDELKAEITVILKNAEVDLDSGIFVRNVTNVDLESILTLEGVDTHTDLEGEITVRSGDIVDLRGELELLRRNRVQDIESTVIVPYVEELDASIELEAKHRDIEVGAEVIVPYREFLDSEATIQEKDTQDDLDSEIEIATTYEDKYIPASVYVRAKWVAQLEAVINVAGSLDLPSEVILARHDTIADLQGALTVAGEIVGGDYAFIM